MCMKRICNLFISNFHIIVILFFLNILPACFYVLSTVSGVSLISKLIQICLNSFLLSFGVIALLGWLRLGKFIRRGVLVLFSLVSVIELFLVFNFKSTFSIPLLNLVYQTDRQEAINFMESFFDVKTLLSLSLVGIVAGGCSYVFHRKKRTIQKQLLKIPHLSVVLSLVVAGGIFLFCYRMFSPFTFYKTITPIHRLLVSGKGGDGIREQKTINEYRKSHAIRLTKEGDKIKNVVFVIGESLNRDHMSLYGYPLKTTPALDLLRGNIFKYEDVISSSPSTFVSINNMFSFAGNDPSSSGLWYQKGLLPDIMKAAGYRTYWISNQTTPLLSDDICDVVVYRDKEVAEELKDGLYDEQLFPIL